MSSISSHSPRLDSSLPASRRASGDEEAQVETLADEHDTGVQTPSSPSLRRPSETPDAVDLKRSHAFRILAGELYRQCERDLEMRADQWSAVALRVSRLKYATFPGNDPQAAMWLEGVYQLNPEACVSFTTDLITGIVEALVPGAREVILSPVDRVQVIETMAELRTARKAQGACFVRQEYRLVAWTDNAEWLIDHIQRLERKMAAYIWQQAKGTFSSTFSVPQTPATGSHTPRRVGSVFHGSDTPALSGYIAQADAFGQTSTSFPGLYPHTPSAHTASHAPSFVDGGENQLIEEKVEEEETGAQVDEAGNPKLQKGRQVLFLSSIYTGLAFALNIVVCSLYVRALLDESLSDGYFARMGYVAIIFPLMLINQFWCQTVIGSIAMIIGPIAQMSANSLYYSGKRTPSLSQNGKLPHITVQMPVYKESLEGVLAPTIESVNRAIATYELQGGTANLLISEDGLQLLDEQERAKRLDYYDVHNCSWVARPGHNVDGYIREGRFKKASNLNETCALSLRVEELMEQSQMDNPEETQASQYHAALKQAVEETNGRMWAAGNIRIGDIILLIDSDTRVPEDCFLDAASEMAASPECGVIQHCSGVMYVANHYFEKMIGFFTEIVNFSISFTVSNGAVAPFVGHNAFLRWRAMQEASILREDGRRDIWSSSHVSEDFDMALRLLDKGYIVRWATYSNGEFLEGVSLTPDDEINRWQKYAYGCSELVLNPVKNWIFKGPLSKNFRQFTWSKTCTTVYKFDACSYIFSYWAIAVAVPMTVANTVLKGFFNDTLDPFYLPSWNVWLSVMVIFFGLGNVGQITAQARSGRGSLLHIIVRQLKWLPMMFIFFGGLSFHILQGLLAHAFSINMSWSATKKDVEESNFFQEIPAIFKRFWPTLLFMAVLIIGLVVVELPVVPIPIGWRIEGGFTVLLPLLFVACCHILYPFVLSPYITKFSF